MADEARFVEIVDYDEACRRLIEGIDCHKLVEILNRHSWADVELVEQNGRTMFQFEMDGPGIY